MGEELHFGRLVAAVADVVDAGVDLLASYEMAAIPVLDGAERPGEWPVIRRRLRAAGIHAGRAEGCLLLTPGELERLSGAGLLHGNDELYLCDSWPEEFSPFALRITSDLLDFNETTPLGLEEWMLDAGCVLALGDGAGLNFATFDEQLAARLRARFARAGA